MSEYFGKYTRPKAEIKVIEKYITTFEQSKKYYKQKNYQKALTGFISGYEILTDIFDIYPRVVTLNSIIKTQFQLNNYNSSEIYLNKLKQYLPLLLEYKKEGFIKYKPKLFLYEFIIDFINEKLEESLVHITEFITYLKNIKILSLEEKVNFFWGFIKNFVKIGISVKSKNFLFFKGQYNAMLVKENANKNILDKIYIIKEKKILREFVSYYKTFMNSKLKELIFESLDKIYYFYKYGKFDEKIVNFLNKNIEIYVESGEKDILMKKFEHYLLITKTDLYQKYNMSMERFISEQRVRIKCFNTAFLNIVGAFNQIFKNYYTDKELTLSTLKKNNSMNLILNKNDIQQMEQRLIKKMKIMQKSVSNKKENEKNNKDLVLPEVDLDINIPLPYENKLKLRNKHKYNGKLLDFSNSKYKELFEHSYKNSTTVNKRNNQNTVGHLKNDNKNTLPIINNTVPKGFVLKKDDKNKIIELENTMLYKKIIYRRINYFLISKLGEIYENVIDRINRIDTDNRSKKYSIESDIINLNIFKRIKEKGFFKINGVSTTNKYNNSFFIFEKFMLINNFYLLGLTESQGKFNEQISKKISYLFPTFLNYLLLEYILSKDKKDFENLILHLLKFEESANDIKDIFLLSYINNKFKINYKYFPFVSGDINFISNILFQSLFYIIKHIIQQYKYEISKSSLNLCYVIILGKILYLINIGNAKALIGYNKLNTNINWDYKIFSQNKKNKKNKTNKTMLLFNHTKNLNLSLNKEQTKEDSNNSFCFKLNNKESLLIGTINPEKKGILIEQEVIKYELNSNDKFIIIGSHGFWNSMNNDETIDIVGKYYNNGLSSEEVAKILVEMVYNKWYEENKNNLNIVGDEKGENNVFNFDDIACIVIYLDIK